MMLKFQPLQLIIFMFKHRAQESEKCNVESELVKI